MMEKIILVHYINTVGMDNEQLSENFRLYGEVLSNGNKDGLLINFILPTTNGGHRIECINPKLLTPKEYNEALKFLEKSKKDLNEFFSNK